MQFWLNKISHPLRGFYYAFKYDFSIRFHVIFGLIALPCLHFLFGPFSSQGQLLLVFCWFLVIITELQNSAIETALDKIHPERHEAIGQSKDLAAAAVVTAATFACVSLLFVLSGKI